MGNETNMRLICSGLSYLPAQRDEKTAEAFYRIPRITIARVVQQFLPDYSMLLLAGELVMDRQTFEGLIRGQIQSGPTVALMLKLLHQEGFIRLEDFNAAICTNSEALEAALGKNLRQLHAWIPAVREWVQVWRGFYEGLQLTLRPRIKLLRAALAEGKPVPMDYATQASAFIHDMGGRFQMVSYYAEEALPSNGGASPAETTQELLDFVSEQLSFTLANQFLSREFDAGLHDWCDFDVFYCPAPGEAKTDKPDARALFELQVPEFIFWHPDHVLSALKDARTLELRGLVRESAQSGQPLNAKKAERLLNSLARLDKGLTKVRLVRGKKAPGMRLQLSSRSLDAPS